MQLQRFSAYRFRNLLDLELEPSEGMNVIYGENAQGKTNVLEGIFLLSTLRSFRTRQLPEALQFGRPDALLQGSVQRGQIRHSLTVQLTDSGKSAFLDRKKSDALQYLGVFDVFLFSYPLLEVIRGGPDDRRGFLDRAIAISRAGYLAVLIQYHRALKQKNALLFGLQRNSIARKEGLEEVRSFNLQLAEYGQEIVRQRLLYLGRIQELLQEKRELFFGEQDSLRVDLRSSFMGDQREIHETLERNMEREIARGHSMTGIHRDEIVFMLNGKEIRKYGSSGQHRAFLLLLLLAQIELYENWRNEKPVLLLDDLDSELDQSKIQSFLRVVRDGYQAFISSSRRELFNGNGNIRIFEIESGKILETDVN